MNQPHKGLSPRYAFRLMHCLNTHWHLPVHFVWPCQHSGKLCQLSVINVECIIEILSTKPPKNTKLGCIPFCSWLKISLCISEPVLKYASFSPSPWWALKYVDRIAPTNVLLNFCQLFVYFRLFTMEGKSVKINRNSFLSLNCKMASRWCIKNCYLKIISGILESGDFKQPYLLL